MPDHLGYFQVLVPEGPDVSKMPGAPNKLVLLMSITSISYKDAFRVFIYLLLCLRTEIARSRDIQDYHPLIL